jgi:hypothetical protein
MDSLFGSLLLLIVAVVAWCVASEGAWGAVLTFFCVVFAGLSAMNMFEPFAEFLEKSGSAVRPFADVVALVGLFAAGVFLLRMATEYFAPNDVELDARVFQVLRWIFAVATGYVAMAFLLTALHTAPLPREFLGFRPEARNFFDIAAPDRQWLGFAQFVSENVLPASRVFDGPRYTVEGTDQTIWPSFPIRYATRREQAASGRQAMGKGGPSAIEGPGGGPQPITGGSSSSGF